MKTVSEKKAWKEKILCRCFCQIIIGSPLNSKIPEGHSVAEEESVYECNWHQVLMAGFTALFQGLLLVAWKLTCKTVSCQNLTPTHLSLVLDKKRRACPHSNSWWWGLYAIYWHNHGLFKVNLEFSFSFPGFSFSGLDLVFKSGFLTWDSFQISIPVLTYFSAIADC